jgi:hypothetical protein
MADPKTVDGLKPDDIKKILYYLGLLEKLLKALANLGLEVPTPLTTAIKRLQQALKAGKLIAEAADEVATELEKLNKAAISECQALDEDHRDACELKVERQYQFRAVKAFFNLDISDPTSFPGALLKKTLKEYKVDEIIQFYYKVEDKKI